MRCHRVSIHGTFDPRVRLAREVEAAGFYTTRWVVAANEQKAVTRALRSARSELDQYSDVRDGLVAVQMEVEEVAPGSWWRWLQKGGGRGFSFYGDP